MNDGYIRSFLGEKEKILLVTRQHWFLLFWSILFEIIVIITFSAAVGTLITLVNPLFTFGFLLLIIPIISLIRDIMIFQRRQYIVTNRRVIQISGVFNKNVTDSSLEKVNDVKLVQSFWGRIFNYGHIEILTASELGANQFRYIGDPIEFKTAMLNAKERMPLDESFQQIQSPVKTIPQLINELDQLRQKRIVTEAEFIEKKKELLAKM